MNKFEEKTNATEMVEEKETVKGKGKSKSKNKRRNNPRDKRTGPLVNHPEWYFLDKTLMDQLTTYPFSQFSGRPIDLDGANFTNSTICINSMSPSLGGNVQSSADGVNIAAFRLYTELSASNAKTTNYAPQDLTTLILALGSLKAYVAYLSRALKTCYLYNVRNRDIPKNLITAQGFDANDLLKNLGAYRVDFNTILTSMSTIPFPASISYLDKCEWLFSNIYIDDTSPMSQIILNIPSCLWKFNEAYSDQGTGLNTIFDVASTENVTTFEAKLQLLKEMRDALLQSSTLNYVYSDILRLASKGEMKLGFFNPVAETDSVVPIFDPVYLSAWHNTVIMPLPFKHNENGSAAMLAAGFTPDLDVVPDANKNVVRFRPVFSPAEAPMLGNVLCDFDVEDPDQVYRIDGTRYSVCGGDIFTIAGNAYHADFVMADWFCNGMSFAGSDENGVFNLRRGHLTNNFMDISTIDANKVKTLADMTKFDWHPILRITNGEADTDPRLFGDLSYYTTLPAQYMKYLNDASFIGLLSVR